MRDNQIISGFRMLAEKIAKMQRANAGTDQEIVTSRIQLNALIRMIKYFFPFNLIFRYLVKNEFANYEKQLLERKKKLEEVKKQMSESKVQINKEKHPKVNDKCNCGSDKKYKKCCKQTDDELKREKDTGSIKSQKEEKEK